MHNYNIMYIMLNRFLKKGLHSFLHEWKNSISLVFPTLNNDHLLLKGIHYIRMKLGDVFHPLSLLRLELMDLWNELQLHQQY